MFFFDTVLDVAAVRRVKPYHFTVPSPLALDNWLRICKVARMVACVKRFLICTFGTVELVSIGR